MSTLSDQRVSEPVFENTIFLLYINTPCLNLFRLLKVAFWVVQSCIQASVEQPRSFMSDNVHNTTDSWRDHNLETVYHLFWLSSEIKGKTPLIPNIPLLACRGTSGLQFKKPVCSSAVSLVWYVWIIRQIFVPFKDVEKWANGNLMKFSKKKCKVLSLGTNNLVHTPGQGDPWWYKMIEEGDPRPLLSTGHIWHAGCSSGLPCARVQQSTHKDD